ncbi:MAG: alpha/beta hydrolase [Rhodospirillales bacterium]|nr:alpha/beta hydrolase [Rhodospirillales bacterium]
MVFLKRWLRLAAAVFAGVLLYGCTSLLFYPTREHVLTPEVIGLDYRDVEFHAADGVRLHGWFLPANDEARGTVLFVHGNAENISTHIASVAWLPSQGYNVFLFDYRGFGASAGETDLDGLHRDTMAAIDQTFQLDGVDPNRIAVFGQSLGGSVAISSLVRSPRRTQVRGLIVEGAFSSYRRIAREKLAEFEPTWLLQVPLSFTIDNRYHPEEDIAGISPVPILVVHGAEDRIVAPSHAEDLFEAARPPKALWLIEGASHIQAFQMTETRERLLNYLGNCVFAESLGGQAPAACSEAALPSP